MLWCSATWPSTSWQAQKIRILSTVAVPSMGFRMPRTQDILPVKLLCKQDRKTFSNPFQPHGCKCDCKISNMIIKFENNFIHFFALKHNLLDIYLFQILSKTLDTHTLFLLSARVFFFPPIEEIIYRPPAGNQFPRAKVGNGNSFNESWWIWGRNHIVFFMLIILHGVYGF